MSRNARKATVRTPLGRSFKDGQTIAAKCWHVHEGILEREGRPRARNCPHSCFGMTIGVACVSLFMLLGGAGIMRGSVAVTLAIFAIASLIATLILCRVFELP